MITLTSRNLKLFAARNYTNSTCLSEDEFNRDFNLANKIEYMFNRGQILESSVELRRIVNLAITYYNVFEYEAATRMLFHLTSHPEKLKTLLVALNRFPEGLEYLYSYDLDLCLLEELKREFK